MGIRLTIQEAERRCPDMVKGQAWVGVRGIYRFLCTQHGEYAHRFSHHVDGHGCRDCADEKVSASRQEAGRRGGAALRERLGRDEKLRATFKSLGSRLGKVRMEQLGPEGRLRLSRYANSCHRTSRRISLLGQKFHMLTVIALARNDRWGQAMWLCECDCGNETIVSSKQLRHRDRPTKSCGCLAVKYERPHPGDVYGRLKVLAPSGGSRYLCECICGERKVVRTYQLVTGRTQSCGCLHSERTRQANFRHGHAPAGKRSPEYGVWCGMRKRCGNPNAKAYADYGGRGIKVCDRWQGEYGFKNFLADMGPRPSPRHQCDRKNPNLGYSPDNCHWATAKEGFPNRRLALRVKELEARLRAYGEQV